MVGHPSSGRGSLGSATAAILFGVVTVLTGGKALSDQLPAGVGAAVPIVLWFNVGAGLTSVLAGAGLLAREPWAVWLASLMAVATLAVFGALGVLILRGEAYGPHAIAVMMLWTVAWQAITVTAWRSALSGRPEV